MTAEQAVAFCGFALVMAATPGPSNTLLTATAAQLGVIRALPALLGVAVGMGILIFTVSLGLGALIVATPALLLALRLAGTAFLLWLAFQIATSAAGVANSSAAPDRSAHMRARRLGFASAAAFQLVNPKSWIASASAAAFLNSSSSVSPFLQAATLALIFVAVALPSCFAWLAFGAALHRLLHSERAGRTFNWIMAALLAASALALLLT